MGRFRVFLGAPSANHICSEPSGYQWHTVSPPHPIAPTPTFEAASRRISLIYQNIIFKDDDEDESVDYIPADTEGPMNLDSVDHTTLITWAPTPNRDDRAISTNTADVSKSLIQENTMEETQDTDSFNYSDSSSIARFPQFHFNLHSLNSISSLSSMVRSARIRGTLKVNVLMAVLEVDGPDTITIKKGRDTGKQVSLLKMILGEEEGKVCKLTAWREVADLWGNGSETLPAIRRGDIVWFQNVLLCWEPPATTLNFTASPNVQPKAVICYRTMAYSPGDNRLRPDLRLGYSDASVRRVSSIVSWFEKLAGLVLA